MALLILKKMDEMDFRYLYNSSKGMEKGKALKIMKIKGNFYIYLLLKI
jgi:hypothetical protein